MLRRYPLTLIVLLVTLFALARLFASFKAVTPLDTAPGFTEALAYITETYPGAVVVVPPLQTAALDKIPLGLTATDAVPQDHANVVFIHRTDEPLVTDLEDERIFTKTFDQVTVDHVDRAP